MRRLAFVMASNGSTKSGKLKYALKDAEKIRACLSEPRYNFEVKIPKPRPKSNIHQLLRQLDLIAESCTPEDTLICYFSGHGILHTPRVSASQKV